MKRLRLLNCGILALFAWGCLTMQADAQQRQNPQQISRAEAIARIAKLYPDRDKSAEQIYDEGQVWEVAKAFSHRFTYRDFDALMGPVHKDTSEIAASRRLDPPIAPKKLIGPSAPTGANPETWVAPDEPAYHDSTYARTRAAEAAKQHENVVPDRMISQTDSVDLSRRVLLSSAAKDYSDVERRDMKQAYFQAMRDLPTDVRISLDPKKVKVQGQHATVEAEYGYKILGKPTMRSASFMRHPKKTIRLLMRRDGEDWKVTNLRGVLQLVGRDIAN